METKPFDELLRDATTGDVEASYELAKLYRLGEGVEQNETHAVEWCRKAAKQGHLSAHCRLGLAYLEGKGVTKDHVHAEEWFRKASKNGHPVAQYFLECIFAEEGGLKKASSLSVKQLGEAHSMTELEKTHPFDPEKIIILNGTVKEHEGSE
jgi:TPR repeat protein